jgi:ADP-heptose:LPS heptosyltransferase
VAEELGLPVNDRHPYLFVSAECTDRVEAKLAARGLKKEEAFAVIHPGARRWYKSWPPERFGRIADAIIQTYGVRLILLGNQDDKETCSTILNLMKFQALDLAGQIKLSELPALIKKSLCVIGNDSGPIHIATSVETPAVALFGPTKWEAWGPRRQQDRIVAAEYPCRPCGHSKPDCPLEDEYCMSAITYEAVWDAVKEVFNSLGVEAPSPCP